MTNDLLRDLWFPTDRCVIAGHWTPSRGGGTLPIEDPSTGAEIGRIARGAGGRVLARIGLFVRGRADEPAGIGATDLGKPLAQARADALALARYMEFYAGAADKVMGQTIPYLEGYTVYTLREPHGVTAHIIPWNYPMQIIGRSVGAALAMGNAVVLKPAEEACLTALAFARLAEEVGLPPGALNVVPGLGEEAGAALAGHPGVQRVSFTGSLAVGRLVQAAAARNVVPVTLELGASPRSWSLPMPISTPRCPSSSMRASRTRARPVRPPRASWSSGPSMTRFSPGWPNATAR